jgi:hypothetical protein
MSNSRRRFQRAEANRKNGKGQGPKKVLAIVPLKDDDLYKGLTCGEYLARNNIANALIVGEVYSFDLRAVVKMAVMITTQMEEDEASKVLEIWWQNPDNRGLKFAAWLPENDIANWSVCGLTTFEEGARGTFFGEFLKESGLATRFVDSVNKGAERDKAIRDFFGQMTRPEDSDRNKAA